MTIEKAQKDFNDIITKNGFTEAAKTTDTQNTVYHREWTREIEVAWHGKQQDGAFPATHQHNHADRSGRTAGHSGR